MKANTTTGTNFSNAEITAATDFSANGYSDSKILFLTTTAIFIALTYVFTAFINIQLPIGGNGGLIHLGNIPLFIAAIVFGRKTGMLAGGVGMGLFDLLSGWTSWAPFTFVIVGLMGYTVGKITENPKHRKYSWYIISIISACVIKIVGYYIAEAILYSSLIVPFASIPGNIIQVGFAGIVILPIIGILNTAAIKIGLKK
jgi:uncharacterized membrane protein